MGGELKWNEVGTIAELLEVDDAEALVDDLMTMFNHFNEVRQQAAKRRTK
jgi:hypothetical protein